MRNARIRRFTLLLTLLLCAALLGGCAGGADKPPTQVTPVPKTSAAPSPTPTAPTPDRPDAPSPAPETEPVTLEAIVGEWELYSTEVEGDFHLAAETDGCSWLIVRDCARADFVEAREGFDTEEHLNCPVTFEPGGLFLNIPDDEYDRECLFARAEGDELELSFSFRNPDGTPGGSTQIFRRLQTPGAEDHGEPVSRHVLNALAERVNTLEENGFFQCTFSTPQEIDWKEVLYNGAGIDCEPSDEAIAELADREGELPDVPIICFTESAIRDFVWRKTLTGYAEASMQVWPYFYQSEDGYLLSAHGDTNFVPVTLTSATVEGDIYRLYYERTDFANRLWEPVPFVMTLRVRGDAWQYISNQRVGAPRATLLTVDYFQEKEDVPASLGVTEFIDTPPLPSDEPNWVWAVLTAREDGVRYRVDRADRDFGGADYYLTVLLDRLIGENVCSGVLDKGERVAVKVNLPWYPTIRVSATKGTLYGELWFGENNMLHVFDSAARRTVVGSDADAEGRGCSPETEDELIAFLCDGDWFWLDADTYEPMAVVRFPYAYNCVIESSEIYFDFAVRYPGGEAGAPDRIRFQPGYDDADWSFLPERLLDGESFGDYIWTAYQLDGEQILYLTQADAEPGVLSYLPTCARESDTQMLLVRYQGATLEESQG